ncbi:PDZ domain-containing protein [Paenibacillus puerhi]|uniref:PDZ domain-containing protein n=1 Tax=Paenibacillus puerhi TaxID=2692622 RepID=UPI0013579EC4|nr:PDZ domain-containing protein [Paenibacillus puerhi]
MNVSSRWYISGYLLVVGLSVLGEAIWVADPIRAGDLYWIDLLQWLASLVAAVPLLWAIGALTRAADRSRVERWIRLAAAISGIGAAALLLTDASRLFAIAVCAATSGLLTLADLLLSEKRRRAGWPRRSLAVISLVLAASWLLFWPTAYQVTSPGFTLNMNRYATVEGGEPRGAIDGVLVIERPAFPIDWLYASLLPHIRIEKRDTRVPLGDIQQAAQLQRTDANKIGSAVAFQKLGLGRGVMPDGVQVVRVPADSPAAGQLLPGDRLIGLKGKEVLSSAELAEAMREVRPGSEAPVKLIRAGSPLELSVKTKESDDAPKRTVFGIQVEDLVQADLPRKVAYRSYLAYQGGPSHGAVLALALLDQLTPGGVTNGRRVAGTGTINAAGVVGRIGGIEQKAYSVKQSGADVFFVPAGQEADARKGAPALNIVPVRTLDDMLEWLNNHPSSK